MTIQEALDKTDPMKTNTVTQGSDEEEAAIERVKDFLTFLAVNRKVFASSQNQAFNALLFFSRHIIKKEFGDIKDIPRAKRKPYIPVGTGKQVCGPEPGP